MYLFYFYVPESHLITLNQALFNIGLGKMGNYDSCCWMSKGKGQFRPLVNSNPFLGSENKLEQVDEYKVEMVCPLALKIKAKEVLLKNHPYETPAYGFLQVSNS